jgi:hypothetical protein
MTLDDPHLAPRLKKDKDIPLLTLREFMACSGMKFTFSLHHLIVFLKIQFNIGYPTITDQKHKE